MLSYALTRGRALAERLMVDSCSISRPGAAVDELTGVPTWTQVYPADPTVASGKCQVSTYEPQESTREVAAAQVTTQRYVLKVPVESFAPEIGDVATITAAPYDANLITRKFRVVALLHKTAATAYRLGVEEVL